jgi:hypothetical protein
VDRIACISERVGTNVEENTSSEELNNDPFLSAILCSNTCSVVNVYIYIYIYIYTGIYLCIFVCTDRSTHFSSLNLLKTRHVV